MGPSCSANAPAEQLVAVEAIDGNGERAPDGFSGAIDGRADNGVTRRAGLGDLERRGVVERLIGGAGVHSELVLGVRGWKFRTAVEVDECEPDLTGLHSAGIVPWLLPVATIEPPLRAVPVQST